MNCAFVVVSSLLRLQDATKDFALLRSGAGPYTGIMTPVEIQRALYSSSLLYCAVYVLLMLNVVGDELC